MNKKNKRIGALEDKFDFPNLELNGSTFQEWVEHTAAMAAHKSQGNSIKKINLLLDYLGLTIEYAPERMVVKKVKSAPTTKSTKNKES